MMMLLLLPAVLPSGARLHGQCLSRGKAYGPGAILHSTGDSELDGDLRSEAARLNQMFRLRAKMHFIDDSASPNAYASPEGVVYLGRTLMLKELTDEENGPSAIMGILAHEWAHIAQITHSGGLPGVVAELHADYLAGYYLGRQKTKRRFDIKGFASSLFAKGDYQVFDPQHHGTPKQRVRAMLAGFQVSELSLPEAYERGLAYVDRITNR